MRWKEETMLRNCVCSTPLCTQLCQSEGPNCGGGYRNACNESTQRKDPPTSCFLAGRGLLLLQHRFLQPGEVLRGAFLPALPRTPQTNLSAWGFVRAGVLLNWSPQGGARSSGGRHLDIRLSPTGILAICTQNAHTRTSKRTAQRTAQHSTKDVSKSHPRLQVLPSGESPAASSKRESSSSSCSRPAKTVAPTAACWAASSISMIVWSSGP